MTEPNATNQAAGGRGEGAVRPDSGRGPEDGSAPLAIVRLLLLAAVLGLVASFAAVVVFEIVVHGVQNLLWSNLPAAAGWQAAIGLFLAVYDAIFTGITPLISGLVVGNFGWRSSFLLSGDFSRAPVMRG